jgi:hypothetical protein
MGLHLSATMCQRTIGNAVDEPAMTPGVEAPIGPFHRQ